MRSLKGHDTMCGIIAETLGIKYCRKLQISMCVGEAVIINAEFFPEIDGIKQVDTILKQYELVEKKLIKK